MIKNPIVLMNLSAILETVTKKQSEKDQCKDKCSYSVDQCSCFQKLN